MWTQQCPDVLCIPKVASSSTLTLHREGRLLPTKIRILVSACPQGSGFIDVRAAAAGLGGYHGFKGQGHHRAACVMWRYVLMAWPQSVDALCHWHP